MFSLKNKIEVLRNYIFYSWSSLLFRTSWFAQGDHMYQSKIGQIFRVWGEATLSEHLPRVSHPWRLSVKTLRPGFYSVMFTTGLQGLAQCLALGRCSKIFVEWLNQLVSSRLPQLTLSSLLNFALNLSDALVLIYLFTKYLLSTSQPSGRP